MWGDALPPIDGFALAGKVAPLKKEDSLLTVPLVLQNAK
jgi:hypothetical protein